MLKRIHEIQDIIDNSTLGTALQAIRAFAQEYHLGNILTEAERISSDYALMRNFFIEGYEDSRREELLMQMKGRVFDLTTLMLHGVTVSTNKSFASVSNNSFGQQYEYAEVEERLRSYYENIAIYSLNESDKEKLKTAYCKLHEYRVLLFNTILSSQPLKESEAKSLEMVLTSALVDTVDKQIIIGSILLATLMLWDGRKFRILCNMSHWADDAYVREQALVGVALTLPASPKAYDKHKYEEALGALCKNDDNIKRLTELQIQLIISLDTDKVDSMIKRDIMPTLKQNAEKYARESMDLDDIESIINPNAEEKNMEEMEAVVERLRNMQKSGVDVLFGGFSHEKRSVFFYTLMNWFCPFYIQHPQITQNSLSDKQIRKIEMILGNKSMCNSDKYSFFISMSKMINMLPGTIRDMLSGDDIPFEVSNEEEPSPTLIRQLYINDLYRFFFLYPYKSDFENVFADEYRVCFVENAFMKSHFANTASLTTICQQLLKRKRYKALECIISRYEDTSGMEMKRIKGLLEFNRHEYRKAYELLIESWTGDNSSLPLLRKIAESAEKAKMYLEAESIYSQIVEADGNSEKLAADLFHHAVCLRECGRVEDAQKVFYRLYFEEARAEYRKEILICNVLLSRPAEALQMASGIEQSDVDAEVCWYKALAFLMNNQMADYFMEISNWKNLSNEEINGFIGKCNAVFPRIEALSPMIPNIEILADIVYKQ